VVQIWSRGTLEWRGDETLVLHRAAPSPLSRARIFLNAGSLRRFGVWSLGLRVPHGGLRPSSKSQLA